ncbi:hypothetical protein UPYG_G00017800 [Umbra pygmaea]|uniref:Uncharacterized protein n=1 Tax=Umbra pygmaea TaxID=75934 RepID=A0ABD0XK18_UMBPY
MCHLAPRSIAQVFFRRTIIHKKILKKMKTLFMVLLLSATKELMKTDLLCDASSCQACGQTKVTNLYIREGEMAVLKFEKLWFYRNKYSNVSLVWNNTRPGMWKSEDTIIILKVSPSDQGIYYCSLINSSGQTLKTLGFNISVYSGKCYTDLAVYSSTCVQDESCNKLECRDGRIPMIFKVVNSTWYKNCDTALNSSFNDGYLQSATVSDSGNYTCTSYYTNNSNLSDGQVFTISRTTERTVKLVNPSFDPKIIKPQDGDVIEVDLGSIVVVACRAKLGDTFGVLFWLENGSFVETNETLQVFYNRSKESGLEVASLVIKHVSGEHLNRNYTCKVQSPVGTVHSSIAFKLRSPVQFHILVLCVVGLFVGTVVVVTVVYIKLKLDIVLFLRDDLGLHRHNVSDGKCYDAYVLCYKSNTGSGVSEEDRLQIENVLEEEFGYSLCLFNRDVLPGEAVADAVLACIEKSRRLILVPSDLGLEPMQDSQYGLLTGLHAALVERQIRMVLIQTETGSHSQQNLELDMVPEALHQLVRSGHRVTWRGSHSQGLSSSFWKELRYHMPARMRQGPPSDQKTLL